MELTAEHGCNIESFDEIPNFRDEKSDYGLKVNRGELTGEGINSQKDGDLKFLT